MRAHCLSAGGSGMTELQTLRAENERLRDQVTVLKESLGTALRAPRLLNLTAMQERIFCAVYRRGLCGRESVMAAMWGGEWTDRAAKSVDVYFVKLRRKCRAHGIEIRTVHARGFEMPEASKHIVRAMYEAEQRATG